MPCDAAALQQPPELCNFDHLLQPVYCCSAALQLRSHTSLELAWSLPSMLWPQSTGS